VAEHSRAGRTADNLLGPLDGRRVPGGCAECDAFQTAELVEPEVWKINVVHDDDCPFLARLEKQGAA
jgi:hypothetical protein